MPERLWPDGPEYEGESIQTDALVLCAFARGTGAARCADLGCGSGILLLRLLWENPAMYGEGVEIRPEAAEAAERNIRRNALEDRCRVYCADLRDVPFSRRDFDLAVANPPYFVPGTGAAAPDPGRAAARQESATLPELCAAAAALLRQGGRLCVVHRPERLPELMAAMEGAGLAVKRLRCVCDRPEAAPSLILCEGRKGGRASMRFERPLLLHDASGAESEEYRRICHREGEN